MLPWMSWTAWRLLASASSQSWWSRCRLLKFHAQAQIRSTPCTSLTQQFMQHTFVIYL